MNHLIIERREDGRAECFWRGALWKRRPSQKGRPRRVRWYKDESDENHTKLEPVSRKRTQFLEKAYRSRNFDQKFIRYPRLQDVRRIADLADIPSVREIPDTNTTWLVDGLIPCGSVTLITAPPAGFKTWLALALAGAVSTGAEFLGRTTIKTPALYLDRENPQFVVRSRLDILNLDDSEFLKVWGRWVDDATPFIDDERLVKFARRYRPLIVFDSLMRFHQGEENSATDMSKVSELLRGLVDAGATVVVLHHKGKAEKTPYRGSTDILAGADVAFSINKKNGLGTTLTLDCYKHRAVEEFTLTIQPDLGNGVFKIIDDPASVISAELRERIVQAIKEQPGMNQKQLMEKVHLPETNGRNILKRGDGKYWQAKRGKNKTLHYHPVPTRAKQDRS
jgi:AAA domain-containing protein